VFTDPVSVVIFATRATASTDAGSRSSGIAPIAQIALAITMIGPGDGGSDRECDRGDTDPAAIERFVTVRSTARACTRLSR
jgi:hypothetical protein